MTVDFCQLLGRVDQVFFVFIRYVLTISSHRRICGVSIIDVYYITLVVLYHPYVGNCGQLVLSQKQFAEIQRICEEVSGHRPLDTVASLYKETSSPFTSAHILPREVEALLD
jgi:hypothetical protein